MKIEREWVGAYFNDGVDLANRRVFISDIEAESVDLAIKGLYLMETVDRKTPCEMFISSSGGDIYEALALYDVMNTLNCPIHTFAYGKCMSAAPLLLAAGTPGYRWVAPHVTLMHHDWSAEVEGKGTAVSAMIKHFEELNKNWTELLVRHSNQTFRWWDSKAKKSNDFYFTADEAIDWGLADTVWVQKD